MSDQRKKRGGSSARGRANSVENAYQHAHSNQQGNGNRSMSTTNVQGKKYQRQASYDHIRKIVQAEGREARNLITWNVPLDHQHAETKMAGTTRPPDGEARTALQQRKTTRSRSASSPRVRNTNTSAADPKSARPKDLGTGFNLGGELVIVNTAKVPGRSESGNLNSSHNSGSGTPKKGDLRARYWAFLFENLRRAVDEIYQTCETDESVVECKEVIMMLERCTKDFTSLIERHILLKAFDAADEDHKPTSLAWEVRKSSPGKGLSASQNSKDFTPSPNVVRSLNFSSQPQGNPVHVPSSWADRVKGIVPNPHTVAPLSELATNNPISVSTGGNTAPHSTPKPMTAQPCLDGLDEDTEGWETVQRNSRTKRPLSAGNKDHNMKDTQSRNNSTSLTKTVSDEESINSKNTDARGDDDMAGVYDRRRTNSLDSEKENQPVEPAQMKTGPLGHAKVTVMPGHAKVTVMPDKRALIETLRIEDLNDPSIVMKGPPVIKSMSVTSQTQKTDIVKPSDLDSRSKVTDTHGRKEVVRSHSVGSDSGLILGVDRLSRSEDTDVTDDDIMKEQVNADRSLRDLTDEVEAAEKALIDGAYDDDEEEAQLDDALASALDAEEDLSSELERQQDAMLESAIEEEEIYLKEIAREESMELEVEPEAETDTELGNTASSTALEKSLDWDSMVQQYDADAEYRGDMSWGDMVDEAETRTPGRVVHMHEKLSSPSRKRSPTESKKRFEEKQAKAQELREKLQQEKTERLKTLTNKVEEVRAWKDELLSQRRETMQRKLETANEKRNLQLKLKVRKAHEEENKANEIAFINTLEAQNKRHDIFIKYQECEARLQDLQEERQKKHEDKLAKEAAVEERRHVLQAERQARLVEMQVRRRHREEVIEQRQQEKEKDRVEAAKAKELYREERIAALNAQQQAHIVELTKKIQQKQEETVRRHKEQLEHISGKAFGMSILQHSTEDHNEAPRLAPYETQKLCSVCNVMIPSEVHLSSHLRGKKHQLALSESNGGKNLSKQEIEEFNLLHITNAPSDKPDPKVASDRERQKAQKKRCKKLRQRMAQRGTEYESTLSSKQQTLDSEHRAKLQKTIKDLNKYLQFQDKGPWPQNKVSALDRGLGEIGRILEKKMVADQNTFRVAGGLTTLSRVMLAIGDSSSNVPSVIPAKSLIHCCTVFRLACKGSYDNCHYMLFSNKSGSLVDMLNHQLTMLIPENLKVNLSSSGGAASLRLPHDPLATSLMQLIATVLSVLAKHNPSALSSEASAERMSTSGDAFMSRANDIVSYIISVGILDRLTQYFNNVRGSIDGMPQVAEFLQHSMGLLIAMIRIISKRNVNVFDSRKKDDITQLVSTFQVTGLVGIVSLMYGMLLHSGTPSRGENAPPELPAHSLMVATVGFRMLNHLATLDLQLLQASLGEEGTSLEFRHISSYLLWYCSHWAHEELLHELILCVSYFTVLNTDNQVIIQSGQPPTVLQQLCSLPFQYFSDPKLTTVLFPTLITCCYTNKTNREILEQELSCALLANFIEEKTLESQTKSPIMAKKSKTLEKEPDTRMSFGCRFPTSEWTKGQLYFKTDQ